MFPRVGVCGSIFLLAAVLFSLMPSVPLAGQESGTPPKWVYAHDLRVRPGGEKDINEKTPKIGVEFFLDPANKALLALSETGSIAVTPLSETGANKKAEWLTAHDLRVRRAGEKEFTQKTQVLGVETFKDLGSQHLLYVSETGSVAFAPLPAQLRKDLGPKWHHALEPKVRRPEQEGFENAPAFGIEVFKDENTGGLIYIAQTGSIATAAAPPLPPDKNKIAAPKPLYGLVLRVRKALETDFSEKTQKIGVEVFFDPNSNAMLYLSQKGSIAVVPQMTTSNVRGVTWKGAMKLKARKGGVKEFDKAAQYGIEVFQDNRTGNLVYICETGSIAVLNRGGFLESPSKQAPSDKRPSSDISKDPPDKSKALPDKLK